MTLESRFNTHEAICSERYRELNKDINEVKSDQKDMKDSVEKLSDAISMGSGAVRAVFILGVIVGTIWTGLKIFVEWRGI